MGANNFFFMLAFIAAGLSLLDVANAQSRADAPDAPPVVEQPGAGSDAGRTAESPATKRIVEPQPGVPGPLKGVVRELRSGPLLIHGNFCGIGNRPGGAPIDPLDAACMRHDACTRTGNLPSCACDDRLRVEATAVARDPRTPPDVQAVATATAAAMAVLICKTGGTVAVPILPQTLR